MVSRSLIRYVIVHSHACINSYAILHVSHYSVCFGHTISPPLCHLETQTIMQVLKAGQQAKHIFATKCNHRSSRAHTLFVVTIKQRHLLHKKTICSTLNIVDLAGSERVKKTGSRGMRFKEVWACGVSVCSLDCCICLHWLFTSLFVYIS